MIDPTACITDTEVKFSEGMSSSPFHHSHNRVRSRNPLNLGILTTKSSTSFYLPLSRLLELDDIRNLRIDDRQRSVQLFRPLQSVDTHRRKMKMEFSKPSEIWNPKNAKFRISRLNSIKTYAPWREIFPSRRRPRSVGKTKTERTNKTKGLQIKNTKRGRFWE